MFLYYKDFIYLQGKTYCHNKKDERVQIVGTRHQDVNVEQHVQASMCCQAEANDMDLESNGSDLECDHEVENEAELNQMTAEFLFGVKEKHELTQVNTIIIYRYFLNN